MLKLYIINYLKQKEKANDDGFTLIELLVVVVIIGILAAIAMPSMLGQAARAKESEAKQHIASINSAQVAYRIENSSFAPGMDQLSLGLPVDTTNYKYEFITGNDTAAVLATPKDTALKGYAGGSVAYTDKINNKAVTTVICESEEVGIKKPTPPVLQTGANTPGTAAICGEGQKKL